MPGPGGPVRFNGYGEYSGFLHHSADSLLYEEELYPMALHLYEALKTSRIEYVSVNAWRKCM